MGVMGGLMAAFAPPEQGEGMLYRIYGKGHVNIILEIQKQFQQMSEAISPMFEGLAKVAGELGTAPYQWVKMKTDELPENTLAAGKDRSEICNVFLVEQ